MASVKQPESSAHMLRPEFEISSTRHADSSDRSGTYTAGLGGHPRVKGNLPIASRGPLPPPVPPPAKRYLTGAFHLFQYRPVVQLIMNGWRL